jgi:hypothetical protein
MEKSNATLDNLKQVNYKAKFCTYLMAGFLCPQSFVYPLQLNILHGNTRF